MSDWVRTARVFEPDPESVERYAAYADACAKMQEHLRPTMGRLHELPRE